MNFRKYLVFLCCIFYFGTIFSQERDSLLTSSYKSLKNSIIKLQYSKPKTAKIYADALLKKALSEHNVKEEYNSYLFLSSLESYFGNISSALNLIDKTTTYAKKQVDTELYIKAISRKGSIYYEFGKYDDAIIYYLKVDSLARITKNIQYQIFSNQTIGNIKTILGKHDEAVKLFSKNESILEPLKDNQKYTFDYTNTIIGLCSAYTYFDIEAAEKYLSKIKEVSSKIKDKDALGYYYSLKGIIFYLKKEHNKAIEALEKADSLITVLGRKRNLFPVYRFQGKAYYDIGDFEKTIEVYEKIKILRDTLGFDHFKYEEIIGMLAESYDTLGKDEKAIENFLLGRKLSVVSDSIQKTLNYQIKNRYDNKNWQEKIDRITKKNKEKEKENTTLIYLAIALVIILISMLFIHKINRKNNKRKFDILLEKLHESEIKKVEKTVKKAVKEKLIPDNEVAKILNALHKFETKNIYLQKNINLTYVAKKLNTNTSYLSKIINTHKGLTFINYITKLRIDYALQNLKNDKVLRSYSIKAISKELGFKSEGAFSRAFKKQTGIYPSFFIKNLTADS